MDHEIEEKKIEKTLSWREKMAFSNELVYDSVR